MFSVVFGYFLTFFTNYTKYKKIQNIKSKAFMLIINMKTLEGSEYEIEVQKLQKLRFIG